MQALAYARFVHASPVVWHPIIDVDTLRTACDFSFAGIPVAQYEIAPHIGAYDDVCGVCEDEIGQATAIAEAAEVAPPSAYDGKWRPSDHA